MASCIIIATTAYMIRQFELENISILQDKGYKVDIAVSFSSEINPMSPEAIADFKNYLEKRDIGYYDIPFQNSLFRFDKHIKSYQKLQDIMKNKSYELCHVHTPFAAAIGRLVAFSVKIPKILYTAHGFHFFKGGPIKNWLIFYPIEKYLSKLTDALIVINNGDYSMAQKKFKVPRIYKIDGVGINGQKVTSFLLKRDEIREKYNISKRDLVLVSVGELNDNKNHQVIIEAVSKIDYSNIKYFIIGKGKNKEKLEKQIAHYGLQETVSLLGYFDNIEEVLPIADVFCFPSKREGLGLAAIEAMALGLPLLTSNVGGINDYMEDGKTGYQYSPLDSTGFAQGIEKLRDSKVRQSMGEYNKNLVQKYDQLTINERMTKIYDELLSQK